MSWWRRTVCRWLGHRWSIDKRGEPVVLPFLVCRRCGKWERIT